MKFTFKVMLMGTWFALNFTFASLAKAEEIPALTEPFDFKLLNQGWSFSAEDSKTPPSLDKFEPVSIPHTWNAVDTLKEGGYRRAGSWYRYSIEALPRIAEGERLYLRFKGIAQVATVFAGQTLIKHHRGSYDSFTVDLTDFMNEKDLFIYASNSVDQHALPLSADFTFSGGMYRNVVMFTTKSASVSRLAGGSGLRIIPGETDANNAKHTLRVDLSNASGRREIELKATVTAPDGTAVATTNEKTTLRAGQSSHSFPLTDIKSPKLWSPDQPRLYSLKLELMEGGKVIDSVTQRFGVRFFWFDGYNGFFLNGSPLKLNGVNRHQDKEGKGIALSEKDHYDDIKSIKDLGVNFLRLAHYQQDDYVLNLCDELGILVWEEIPYVNAFGEHPDFVIDLHNAMRAMVVQHYNHPSIILWGLGNEVLLRETKLDSLPIYNALTSLNQAVHDLDPSRFSTMAFHGSSTYRDLKLTTIPDVVGYNIYTGWYSGGLTVENVVSSFERFKAESQGKPMIISEYGADADPRINKPDPVRYDYSIQYQNSLIKTYLEAIKQCNWLTGHTWWCYNDFASYERGYAKSFINQKGLVSSSRAYKKDAYYIMQSAFPGDPMLRILGHDWKERYGPTKQAIEVTSNTMEVELVHNGKSLGAKKAPFIWDVMLTPGDNELSAKSIDHPSVTDSCKFNFVPGPLFSITSPDGDAALLIDADRETMISHKESLRFEMTLRKEDYVKKLKLGLSRTKETEFDYVLSAMSSKGEETVLQGKTQKDRYGSVDIFIKRSCSKINVTLMDKNSGQAISLFEVDMMTGSEQGTSAYETVGKD